MAKFHCGSAQGTINKLCMFASAGVASTHVVADFDLTLTSGQFPGRNIGTWDVMDELMPPEGAQKHREIYQSFRPIERQGGLTEEIAAEKWAETLDLITSYPINIADIREAFLSVAKLRDGVKSLFDACGQLAVPTVVLSSGIKDVITQMTDHYGINPDLVLSNELQIDTSGIVRGWSRTDLIHILNKKEMGHKALTEIRHERPQVLLLGDVPDDTKMVDGDNVIRIRVLDPRAGESHILDEALDQSYQAGYDLVVEHDLSPVADIVKWLARHSEP